MKMDTIFNKTKQKHVNEMMSLDLEHELDEC